MQNSSSHPTVAPAALTRWRSLPKVLLHEHLDGGLRPETLFELCQQRNIAIPAKTPDALAAWLLNNSNSGSLTQYLEGFAITVAAMASPEACERVAFEAAEDALADGCVLAEFRMAPLLLEPFGVAPEAVMGALLSGLAKSTLPSGLIVCAMRSDSPAMTERAAKLAVTFKGNGADRGAIGFDLAGAELGFPPRLHQTAIQIARDAGLGFTCHAGEADGGARVLEAAALGATRIGHGVQIMSPPDAATGARWVSEARAAKLHFEVCPTSNVHTGAATSLAAHPIQPMLAAGLSVSISTDNRLMSAVTLSEELASLHAHGIFNAESLRRMMADAATASFLSATQKAHALQRIAEADFSVAAR